MAANLTEIQELKVSMGTLLAAHLGLADNAGNMFTLERSLNAAGYFWRHNRLHWALGELGSEEAQRLTIVPLMAQVVHDEVLKEETWVESDSRAAQVDMRRRCAERAAKAVMSLVEAGVGSETRYKN